MRRNADRPLFVAGYSNGAFMTHRLACERGDVLRRAEVPNPATGESDTTNFRPIGNTLPNFNWGIANTFRFGGLSVYALFDAQVGGDVYNATKQWAARENNAWWVDQGAKPRTAPEDQEHVNGFLSPLLSSLAQQACVIAA